VPIASAAALQSEGKPLDAGAREFFESRFDRDLSAVRVHQGPTARAAAHVLGAQAFAKGNDIAWPDTAPAIDSPSGRRLMAHELTHVAQQQNGATAGSPAGSAAAEREAKVSSTMVPSSAPIAVSTATRPSVAFSVEEWLTGSPDLSTRSDASLNEDIRLIDEWLRHQTGTTPDVLRLEDALTQLHRELARRRGAAQVPQAPNPIVAMLGGQSGAAVPDVLANQRSVAYADVDAMRRDVNAMIAFLDRTDVSESDRVIVQTQLSNVEPLTGIVSGFKFDHSDLPGVEAWKMEPLARRIAAAPMVPVRLVGHTDPVGTHQYNVDLGKRRASEVKRQLNIALETIRSGLSSQVQFVIQSPGEADPITSNRTEAGRAANRRVEVFVPVAGPTITFPVPVPPVPPVIVIPGPITITPNEDDKPTTLPPIHAPRLPFDPRTIGQGSKVTDPSGKGANPIWAILGAVAGGLRLTISASLSEIPGDVLSEAVGAALDAFLIEGTGTAGVGLAGERAAEVILEHFLADKTRVFSLNELSKRFPLVDLITPYEIPSVKNFGILAEGSYENVRPNLMSAFKQLIGEDWPEGSRYRKLTQASEELFEERSRIPKQVLPKLLRSAKSATDVEAALQELATMRIPDDYVEPFRRDVAEYMAKKMGVSIDINGKLLPGRKLTSKAAGIIQAYENKVQSIGLRSSDFKILLETAKEEAKKRIK